MTTTVMTTKGQIIIPSRLRQKFNLKKGVRFSVEEKGDTLVLQPLTEDYFEKMAGILKSKNLGSKTLMEDRREEKILEEKKWSKS